MRLWTGMIAALLLSAPIAAVGADLPVKAPPVVVETWNWTGFYVGANAGYSWGPWNSSSNSQQLIASPGLVATSASPRVNGAVVGGQAGYNWQINYWVVGLETDWQWTGERASSTGTQTFGPITLGDNSIVTANSIGTSTWSLPWFGTFRGRLGWDPGGHWLLYATGGLAYGRVKFDNTSSAAASITRNGVVIAAANTASSVSGGTTRMGWSLGAGVEKALTRNWSIKAEYLYVDLGSVRFVDSASNFIDIRARDHIARIGINYRFDAGPIVARY